MKDDIKKGKVTPINKRMFNSQVDIMTFMGTIEDAIFQHSVLCQTFLPYRNLGDDVTIWKHKQGDVNLAIQANQAYNPEIEDYEQVGLPYGAKARLILAHINSEAIRNQSPVVDVQDSMSAFIRRIGLNVDGRTIAEVKKQIRRLTVSTLSLGYKDYQNDSRGVQIDLKIIKAFDIWFPKDDRQRVLWTSTIRLTDDYFNSLSSHAIPLDERALAALAHNAMALDVYAWLAQRLHRVDKSKPQFIPWSAIKDQFGKDYSRMCDFKRTFRKYLKLALMQYPTARIKEEANKGYWLHNSPSPIEKKTIHFLNATN
jgi:hypothetical protein